MVVNKYALGNNVAFNVGFAMVVPDSFFKVRVKFFIPLYPAAGLTVV